MPCKPRLAALAVSLLLASTSVLADMKIGVSMPSSVGMRRRGRAEGSSAVFLSSRALILFYLLYAGSGGQEPAVGQAF